MICPEEYIKVGCKVTVDTDYLTRYVSGVDPDQFRTIVRTNPSDGFGKYFNLEGIDGLHFYYSRITQIKGYFRM